MKRIKELSVFSGHYDLHGGNGISPLNIRIFIPLLKEYCVIAPDVIGMLGKSEPYRNLNTNKDDYGLWLGEVMDNMNLLFHPIVLQCYYL